MIDRAKARFSEPSGAQIENHDFTLVADQQVIVALKIAMGHASHMHLF